MHEPRQPADTAATLVQTCELAVSRKDARAARDALDEGVASAREALAQLALLAADVAELEGCVLPPTIGSRRSCTDVGVDLTGPLRTAVWMWATSRGSGVRLPMSQRLRLWPILVVPTATRRPRHSCSTWTWAWRRPWSW